MSIMHCIRNAVAVSHHNMSTEFSLPFFFFHLKSADDVDTVADAHVRSKQPLCNTQRHQLGAEDGRRVRKDVCWVRIYR